MPKAKSKPPTSMNDVVRPNDSAPSENSKSVFITKRPLMRDPMMAAPVSGDAEPGATPAPASTVKEGPAVVTHQLRLVPPSSLLPPTKDEVAPPAAETEVPTIQDEASTTEQPVAATPETSASPSDPTLTAPDQSVTTNREDFKRDPLTPDAEAAAAEDAEKERRAGIDALIESQKYFLPVDAGELKKVRRFLSLGVILILLLGASWADVSLDAGLIHIAGIKAPTHFFSN